MTYTCDIRRFVWEYVHFFTAVYGLDVSMFLLLVLIISSDNKLTIDPRDIFSYGPDKQSIINYNINAGLRTANTFSECFIIIGDNRNTALAMNLWKRNWGLVLMFWKCVWKGVYILKGVYIYFTCFFEYFGGQCLWTIVLRTNRPTFLLINRLTD